MWYGSGFSFKGIAAGGSALELLHSRRCYRVDEPVTAKNAAPTVSVNRIIKGDRFAAGCRLPAEAARSQLRPKRRFESRHWSVASQPSAPFAEPRAGAYSLALSDLMRTDAAHTGLAYYLIGLAVRKNGPFEGPTGIGGRKKKSCNDCCDCGAAYSGFGGFFVTFW